MIVLAAGGEQLLAKGINNVNVGETIDVLDKNGRTLVVRMTGRQITWSIQVSHIGFLNWRVHVRLSQAGCDKTRIRHEQNRMK